MFECWNSSKWFEKIRPSAQGSVRSGFGIIIYFLGFGDLGVTNQRLNYLNWRRRSIGSGTGNFPFESLQIDPKNTHFNGKILENSPKKPLEKQVWLAKTTLFKNMQIIFRHPLQYYLHFQRPKLDGPLWTTNKATFQTILTQKIALEFFSAIKEAT